ncbi:MAG TPA: DUF3592 domain-containing protein [Anaerolineales bacterium]|nr:DUF3592 domain-containing protein [Anaerolineales bacterium]
MSRRRSGLRFGRGRRRGFSNPFAGLIVGPFLVVFGAILLIVGWGWYSKTNEWAAAGGTAIGTVVEMKQYEKTTDNGTSIMYQPVIEFRTETGEVIVYTDPTSTSSPRHQIGDQVEIVYDRNFPTNARENNFLSLHFPDAIVMGMGGFFLLMGLIGGIRSLVLVFVAGGIAAYLLAKKKENEEKDQLQV